MEIARAAMSGIFYYPSVWHYYSSSTREFVYRGGGHIGHRCIIITRYWTPRRRLFIPMELLAGTYAKKNIAACGFTSMVHSPLNMHSSVLPPASGSAHRLYTVSLFSAPGIICKYKTSMFKNRKIHN